jgi:hypothetical protein
MADGAMLVASDRLPATPSSVVALPERLGGGFVFAIGPHLWAAGAWLRRANALFTSPLPIAQVLVGLDRIYMRSPQGALAALDPRTGIQLDLGPLPASPNVGKLAALDAWRAVAVADLRGTLLTLDAGSTWRPLALPIDPTEVVALGDSIAVGGPDEGRQVQWWEVRPDGQAGKLSSAPPPGAPPDRAAVPIEALLAPAPGHDRASDAATRAFGPRPLEAAIEDGWPLTDGTALVARDGAIARVRLTDGALVESVAAAFPLKPARCHALASTSGAVFFACGEPRGRTVVYRWDAPGARLVELQRFENPRQVLGFSNGAFAVRGSCVADATDEAIAGEQAWCVMAPGAAWREMRLPSDERLVVLSDARVVLVRPPRAEDLSTARLTITDGAHASELPIALPPLRADVAQALRLGTWMDGFEERRPGVIGGWVDAAGAIVGVEISVDGEARVGEYIRDAGAPIASGRWAFGWTASRRGFETTDGGMTWTKEIPLPDPIASGRRVHERACGPAGCIAAGWLRVGWGALELAPASEPPPRIPPPLRTSPNLELDCEALGGPAPEEAGPAQAPAPASTRRSLSRSTAPRGPAGSIYAAPTWGAVSALPPFGGREGPAMPADNTGVSVEASSGIERTLRDLPLARIYAWGPKTGEWDQFGRWQVRWQWPWGGGQAVRSSAASAAPWTSGDAAGRALGKGPGTPTAWAVAESDDPDHALLVARRAMAGGAPTIDILLLEADRPPIEAHRAGGEPFPDIEGAARLGGRWFVATTQSPGELAATVLWSFEGATAHEVVRVPRVGLEARPALRLARRADGRALGLVVDGQRDELRATTRRWVMAVDITSNSVATPEPLAPVDLSDRTVSLCTGDDAGWEVDLPYPGTMRLHIGPRWDSVLGAPLARMRVSHDRACVERVLGSVDGSTTAPSGALARATYRSAPGGRDGGRAIEVSVFSARVRHALRCTGR